MAKPKVITVTNYMAAGLAAILSAYGREDYDYVMNNVIIPGFTNALRIHTGSGRVSEMAEDYNQMIREYPEAFSHLVVMAVCLGIGFSAMEEIR